MKTRIEKAGPSQIKYTQAFVREPLELYHKSGIDAVRFEIISGFEALAERAV